MIHTSRQLKDLVRNLSLKSGIEAQALFRKYIMGEVINEILNISLDDNVVFRMIKVSEIMEEADYGGLRFSLDAILDGAKIPLKIDVSTGDVITPKEMKYAYKLMFEDRKIPIMAYPIETVLAEKLETIISRSTTNTRMRDFYDIHILLKSQDVDYRTLSNALKRTANKRGSLKLLENAEEVLNAIETDEAIKKLWNVYCDKFTYVNDFSWEEVMTSVCKLSVATGLIKK